MAETLVFTPSDFTNHLKIKPKPKKDIRLVSGETIGKFLSVLRPEHSGEFLKIL